MQAFDKLTSTFMVLPVENIDTDQIIPARFLKQTHREGLGDALFYDWRYHPDGSRVDHVLNQRSGQADQILVAARNFGCGSSREHAVWALQGYGFRVVISPSIGDIFKSNALKNGLLPIEVTQGFYERIRAQEVGVLFVDLERQEVKLASGEIERFAIDPFARLCLLQGVDQLGYLLGMDDAISRFERRAQ
ncbi:3-isopropylmalate dehydratase small subunit [Oligoflexus tunisiensis]|uniref:3-isopropylmalate dehydratase small subunit n=1 Tax=Oligoflexus tunisiensis TaxID=708132 RepID=UPI000B140EA5|nr:3-isopropylmalate dehydratase small subunit [Oligoflexus tunisiensis]